MCVQWPCQEASTVGTGPAALAQRFTQDRSDAVSLTQPWLSAGHYTETGIVILCFTEFMTNLFCDFFRSKNVMKHTLFKRIFNLASDDAIPAKNISIFMVLFAEMTSYVKV